MMECANLSLFLFFFGFCLSNLARNRAQNHSVSGEKSQTTHTNAGEKGTSTADEGQSRIKPRSRYEIATYYIGSTRKVKKKPCLPFIHLLYRSLCIFSLLKSALPNCLCSQITILSKLLVCSIRTHKPFLFSLRKMYIFFFVFCFKICSVCGYGVSISITVLFIWNVSFNFMFDDFRLYECCVDLWLDDHRKRQNNISATHPTTVKFNRCTHAQKNRSRHMHTHTQTCKQNHMATYNGLNVIYLPQAYLRSRKRKKI